MGCTQTQHPSDKSLSQPSFDNEIRLETDADYTGIINWELYNLFGKQLAIGTVHKTEAGYLPEVIGLPPLQTGMYIFRCKLANGHILSTKLLKLSL